MELWQGAVVSWGGGDGDSCFLMYEIGNKRSAKVNARTSRDLGAWCDWDVGCRGSSSLGWCLHWTAPVTPLHLHRSSPPRTEVLRVF